MQPHLAILSEFLCLGKLIKENVSAVAGEGMLTFNLFDDGVVEVIPTASWRCRSSAVGCVVTASHRAVMTTKSVQFICLAEGRTGDALQIIQMLEERLVYVKNIFFKVSCNMTVQNA